MLSDYCIKNLKKKREIMGFVSHRVERSKLEAGDHIYTWRNSFTYSHHGIYIGEDIVVHFTQTPNLSPPNTGSTCLPSHNWSSSVNSGSTSLPTQNWSSSVGSGSPCLSPIFCGFREGESGVTLSCLNCFLENGSLYRYQYGVSTCTIIAKRGGTCTTAKCDDPEAVIHRAMYLLDNGFGEYQLLKHNCEDFALYCKTGLLVSSKLVDVGGSGQASSAFTIPVAAISALPVRMFISNPYVLGAVATVKYASYRYSKDIGARKDVVKVEAKEVPAFLRLRWS